MSEKSFVSNYLFNLLNTITGLLFPLITFPYAARILLPSGIGMIQFYTSIIEYISLATSLGLPLYAVREVARVRNNPVMRNKVATEILLLHFILSLFGYLIVFILVFSIDKIQHNTSLFFLLSISILFNTISINWFFHAIEEFKYIAIRSLVIRFFSLIALFVFVHEKEDLLYYSAITVCATAGGALFNFCRFFKLIKGQSVFCFRDMNILKHLAPSLNIFTLNIITGICLNLNTVMLGFLSTDESVGYYSAAVRLIRVQIGVLGSLGVVLLPRLSNLIYLDKKDEFNILANKSLSYIIAVALPLSISTFFLSDIVIEFLCGPDFNTSILILKILSPTVVFIGVSSLLGMQILYPLGHENIIIKSFFVGLFVNVFLNLTLVNKFESIGVAVSSLITEFIILSLMFYFARNLLNYNLFNKQNLVYLFSSMLVSLLFFTILNLNCLFLYRFLYCVIIIIPAYFFVLYLFKDPLLGQVFKIIKTKIR